MPTSLAELKTAFAKLGLSKNLVIAHASLKEFDSVDANIMLDALLDSTRGIIIPAFTYKTMLNPEVGPPRNGITYGSETDLNKLDAERFPLIHEIGRVTGKADTFSYLISALIAGFEANRQSAKSRSKKPVR